MAAVNIFLILSLFCLLLYCVGVVNYLTRYEDNACDMTYMYEYPQFIKIDIPDGPKFSKYTLYAYSEGRLTEKARHMIFDGIPVLFIPGNAGSYKQVRSLASVSLRKYLNSRTRFHFDYFTVDLNEEYSGLFGGVLEAQSEFVNTSINAILNLYDERSNHPESVILIGHSMGGIIAQHVSTLPGNAKKINTILTLASPNKNPIATLDYLTPEFYGKTFEHWDQNRLQTLTKETIQKSAAIKSLYNNEEYDNIIEMDKKSSVNDTDLSNILFLTIGGGMRDVLVPSGLTYSRFGNINVLTTSIPLVWLSTDHQCIVWCLQLVLVLNRCLFNMVDNKTKQISTNFHSRLEAASKFLTVAHGPSHSKTVYFHPEANWIEDNRRLFSIRYMKGLNATRYQMIRLVDSHLHQMIAVEVLNLDNDDWIFGCAANFVHDQSRICKDGLSLSNHTRHLPSVRYSRRIVYMDLHKIKRKNPSWTHVIFKISPTNEPIQLNFDIYNRDERIVKTTAPRLLSFSSSEILSSTPPNVVHYDVTIGGFTALYQALVLDLKPTECSTKTYHAVATMFVPWMSGDSSVHYFTESRTEAMSLRLHQTQPQAQGSSNSVRIRFVLDPNCKYSISIRSSPLDSLGQLARHYSLSVLPYMASILILAARQQLLQLRAQGHCTNLLTAMTSGAKPYYVVTVAKIAHKFIGSDPGIPMLLPLLSFAVAWALVYLAGLLVYIGIAFAGRMAHFLMLRIISIGFSGWAVSGLQRLPIAMGVFIVALGAATCGGITLLAATLFYSILLSKMYEDYMDTMMFSTVRKVAKRFIAKATTSETADESTEDARKEEKLSEKSEKNNEQQNTSTKADPNKDMSDETSVSQEKAEGEIKERQTSEKNNYETDEKCVHTSSDLDKVTPEEPSTSQINDNIVNNENNTPQATTSGGGSSKIAKILRAGLVKKLLNKIVDVVLPESDVTLSVIHFHITIFLFLMLATLLSVPTILTWTRNFKYDPTLEPDPTLMTAAIIGGCVSIIWQMDVPKINLPFSIELGYIMYILAATTLIFSNVGLYTINYCLASALILITVHQCMPNLGFKEHCETIPKEINPTENSTDQQDEDEDKQTSAKYKVMKAKIHDD